MLDYLTEDTLMSTQESLEGVENAKTARRVMYDFLLENMQTSIGGAAGNLFTCSFQFVMQIQKTISAIREHHGDNTSIGTGAYKVAFSRHVLRIGESIVDIFNSESNLHKNIIFHVFSDGFEDNVMKKIRFGPLCCSTLEILTKLLDYQGRLESERLVRG